MTINGEFKTFFLGSGYEIKSGKLNVFVNDLRIQFDEWNGEDVATIAKQILGKGLFAGCICGAKVTRESFAEDVIRKVESIVGDILLFKGSYDQELSRLGKRHKFSIRNQPNELQNVVENLKSTEQKEFKRAEKARQSRKQDVQELAKEIDPLVHNPEKPRAISQTEDPFFTGAYGKMRETLVMGDID